MTGDEGSLGDIRKALAGISRRLDALAEAVGVAAANAPPGALLDEPTRAHLAGLRGLLAIGRGTTPSEASVLAIDRVLTQARADCAAIIRSDGSTGLTVVAQRGFRLPLAPGADEGIVGRAIRSGEVVQGGPGLGVPDAVMDAEGLGAALAVPLPDRAGAPFGALLAGRRRAVPMEPDVVAALVLVADRLADALGPPPESPREEPAPATLFESLDPARTGEVVAREAAARLGADVAAVLLPNGDGFVLAGASGLPHDAPAPRDVMTLESVASSGRPWRAAATGGDTALARWLGTMPRAVLPLASEDGLVALLVVGGPESCGTALPPSFAGAATLALRNARLHAESLRTAAGSPPPTLSPAAPVPLGDMASLLAIILGRLAAVRDRVADPGAARDLAQAEEAAWRVAEALRGVLGFTPGSGAPPAAPIDFAALVRESVRATERLWAGQGGGPPIALDLETVPPVAVHPDEFRQVLHHLLQNAREAMDGDGGVTVRLRWDGGSRVEVSVTDHGRGMNDATRARAGEPFFTTKGTGRLGVGLAVARAMAERHRGELELETAPGRGTTARLRLGTATGAWTPPVAAKPRPPVRHRVLVVDDDDAVRETLAQSLTRDGYVVDTAGNVGDAVALLGREAIDLVVTDLVLPGGSGLEVARTVKRSHPATPVILITGWPGRVAQETLEAHGIDALVEKPAGLDTIRSAVASLIDRAAARAR